MDSEYGRVGQEHIYPGEEYSIPTSEYSKPSTEYWDELPEENSTSEKLLHERRAETKKEHRKLIRKMTYLTAASVAAVMVAQTSLGCQCGCGRLSCDCLEPAGTQNETLQDTDMDEKSDYVFQWPQVNGIKGALEPETLLSNEPESIQEIEPDKLAGYAISEKYIEYGLGNQGLIPVCNEQGYYGLVTYDDEIVVPFAYDSGCWMVNGEGQSFFEKDGINVVFDRDGQELFRTERIIRSVNEGVVFVKDGSYDSAPYAYYGLDGTLLYASGEDDGYQKGAVGFNEGYAFMGEDDIMRLHSDGTVESMASIIFQEDDTDQPSDRTGSVIVDSASVKFVDGICIGAAKGGYFLSKKIAASTESYGIYTLRSIDGSASCSWDISNIFNKENLKFSTSDVSWDFAGYYDDGNVYYNNGTYMCAYIDVDGEDVYYLVDVSKMTPQEYTPQEYTPQGEFRSDEDYWDFDMTVLTDEALIARAGYIGFNAENYWLIEQNGKWGYIDHAGTVMGLIV